MQHAFLIQKQQQQQNLQKSIYVKISPRRRYIWLRVTWGLALSVVVRLLLVDSSCSLDRRQNWRQTGELANRQTGGRTNRMNKHYLTTCVDWTWCLFACLFVWCLSVCLFVWCPPVCLCLTSLCLPACLFVRLMSSCLSVCLSACLPLFLSSICMWIINGINPSWARAGCKRHQVQSTHVVK